MLYAYDIWLDFDLAMCFVIARQMRINIDPL